MNLSSENPIVKENIGSTLYELVNTLLYLTNSIPSLVEINDKDEHLITMTTQHFSGFKNNLDVIRAATESAYTQYHQQHSEHIQLISGLEKQLADAIAEKTETH